MADLVVSGDLKKKFSEFRDIAQVTASVELKLSQINDLNRTAAGTEDETAKAYHVQVDSAMRDLSSLVQGIKTLFDTKADDGDSASDIFDKAQDNASSTASQW